MTLTSADLTLSRPRTGRTALFCQALQPRAASCRLTSRTAHLRPLTSRAAATAQATPLTSRAAATAQATSLTDRAVAQARPKLLRPGAPR